MEVRNETATARRSNVSGLPGHIGKNSPFKGYIQYKNKKHKKIYKSQKTKKINKCNNKTQINNDKTAEEHDSNGSLDDKDFKRNTRILQLNVEGLTKKKSYAK
jgi:hypothetical protein